MFAETCSMCAVMWHGAQSLFIPAILDSYRRDDRCLHAGSNVCLWAAALEGQLFLLYGLYSTLCSSLVSDNMCLQRVLISFVCDACVNHLHKCVATAAVIRKQAMCPHSI